MQRRHVLSLLSALGALGTVSTLPGCGFELRHSYTMAFRTIQLSGFKGNSPLATELARALEANGVTVVDSALKATQSAAASAVPVTHIEFHALRDKRETLASAKTAFNQVRTVTARTTLTFQIKRSDGTILLPTTEVVLARDLTYNERDALAKQDESDTLNQALQTDIVNQVMRRLAAIRPEQLIAPPEPAMPSSSSASGSAPR